VFAGSRLSPRASGAWNKILAALGLHGSRTFSTADLVALLSGHEADAVGQLFADEFRRDPQLMEIWSEYEKGGGDLAWLARRLSDSRAFTELLNRHADDPRFLDLAMRMALDLDASLAYRRNEGDPGAGLATNRPLRARAAKASGPVDAKGAQAWQPPVLASLGPRRAGALQAGSGPELFAAQETAVEKGDAKGVQQSQAGDVGREHGVEWKLKDTVSKAGPDKDILQFLESLFRTMAKGDRDYLIDQCAEHGNCDPKVACNASAALWASCTQACAANPKCTIDFPRDRPTPPSDNESCAVKPWMPGCHDLNADDHNPPADPGPEDGGQTGTHAVSNPTLEQRIDKCRGGDMPTCRQLCENPLNQLTADYCEPVRREIQEQTCSRLTCNPGCPSYDTPQCQCQRSPCSQGCPGRPSWCTGSPNSQ